MSEQTNKLLNLFSKLLRHPKFMMALRMDMMSEKLRQRGDRTGAQGLLIELWKKDGLTNGEIAELLDIKPSSVTAQVKNLENAGLVERRQDEEDKRSSRVFLTEKGQKAQEKRQDLHDNISSDLFDGLNTEEQEQLSILLNKLLEANADGEMFDYARQLQEEMMSQFDAMRGGFGGRHGGGPRGHHDAQRERWARMSDNERRRAMRDSMPFGEDWKNLFDNMKKRHNPWNFGQGRDWDEHDSQDTPNERKDDNENWTDF